jgi:hypothetical protein
MGRSDSPPSFRPRFVSFAWPYHVGAAQFVVSPYRPLPAGRDAAPARPGVCCSGCSRPGIAVETAGSPRFLGDPLAHMPCPQTPVGQRGQAPYGLSGAAFRQSDGVGSTTTISVSGLNHTACALAVYASRWGLPSHHARLASGCGPALPGGTAYPLGPYTQGLGFHFATSCRPPPCPGFAWRTRFRIGRGGPWRKRGPHPP